MNKLLKDHDWRIPKWWWVEIKCGYLDKEDSSLQRAAIMKVLGGWWYDEEQEFFNPGFIEDPEHEMQWDLRREPILESSRSSKRQWPTWLKEVIVGDKHDS